VCTRFKQGFQFTIRSNKDVHFFISIIFIFVGYLTFLSQYTDYVMFDDGTSDIELVRIWKESVDA
jgi:hypothetical protein